MQGSSGCPAGETRCGGEQQHAFHPANVTNQQVVISFHRDGKRLHRQVETLQPTPDGRAGVFLTPYKAKRDGRAQARMRYWRPCPAR